MSRCKQLQLKVLKFKKRATDAQELKQLKMVIEHTSKLNRHLIGQRNRNKTIFLSVYCFMISNQDTKKLWSIYKHVTFIRITFSEHNKQKMNTLFVSNKKLQFILPR